MIQGCTYASRNTSVSGSSYEKKHKKMQKAKRLFACLMLAVLLFDTAPVSALAEAAQQDAKVISTDFSEKKTVGITPSEYTLTEHEFTVSSVEDMARLIAEVNKPQLKKTGRKNAPLRTMNAGSQESVTDNGQEAAVESFTDYAAFDIKLTKEAKQAKEYHVPVVLATPIDLLDGHLPEDVSAEDVSISNVSYTLYHFEEDGSYSVIGDIQANREGNLLTEFSFTTTSFSDFLLKYTVDFVYIEKKTEISINLGIFQENSNELGQLLYKNSKGLEELAVSDILDFAQDYLQDENVCGEVYTVSLQNGTALSDFDQNFFANSAVSIEGKGIEYGSGKITLLESFDEAKITFASEAGTLELTLENYTAPEKPVIPETEEGFAYRLFTEEASIAEILAANEIVSSYYSIISLSDENLVTIKGDEVIAENYFDEVILTVSLSDGTEVEIMLTNPAPVKAGEIVATNGIGSFAATEEVPAGTMLVVNSNPKVPEGIVLPGSMRKGGPVESEPVFFEVSLVGPDGEPVKAGADVTLNTAIKLPEAPKGQIVKVTGVKVYHIGEKGDAEELEGATYALAEGKISSVSFTTPGFSLFAITYTVDFISAEVNKAWSWPGEGSYSVADIMTEIGVTGDIESVDLVRTDDQGGSEKALYLDEKEDGWYLVSEEAFQDTFVLKIVADGVTYTFTVTDIMENTTTSGRTKITENTANVTGYLWSLESNVTYNETEEKYSAEMNVNFTIQPQYIDTANGYYIELGDDISLPESMLNRNFVARDDVKDMNSFMYRYVRQTNGKYAVLIDYYPEYVNSYYVNNEWTGPITDNYINFVALIEKITTNNQSQQVIQITDTLQVTVPDDKIEYPENEDKNNSIHGQKAYSGYTIDNDGKIHVIYTAHISSSKGTESAVQVTDVLNTYINGNPGYTYEEGNPAISSVAITGFKKNGSDQTVPTVTPTVETNKITMAYEVPQMAANDYYDVTYEYVYDKAFLKNTNTTDSYTIQYGGSNELTLVTGTLQDTANASFDITKTNDVVKLQKGNGYDANEQAINWSIWVSFNGNNGTRTVVDDGFASAVSGSLKVYDQTGTEVTSGWSLSGNTITFTESGDQEYTIRYQTAAEQREYDAQTVTNTATAYHGNDHFETKTSTATIPANGTIEKELMPGATYTTGSDGNGAYREYTLTWHMYMPVPAVGFAAGTVITETLNAYVWNVNNSVRGNHYFTESQKTALLNALKVYFGNDFTLTWADDNSDSQNLKYTITLGSAWTNPSNVEALDFEYSTTGRLYMDNVTVKMGGSSSGDSFTNTITVGGVSDDAKWEYTQLLQKKARVGTSNYSNANLGEIHPSDQRTLTWDIILVLDNNYDSLSVTDTLPAGLTLKNILVGSEWNAWSLLKQSANASTFEILPNGTWYNGLGQEEGWNNYGDVYKSDATDGNRFGSSSENGLVATGSVSGQTVSVNLQMVGSDRPIVFTKGSVFFVRIVAHIDDGEFNDYTNQAKTYTNSASVSANESPLGTASSSQTTTLVSDTLSKNEAHGSFNDNAEGGGNHTLNYTIDINKDGHSLLGGSEGTLTLDDVLSYVKDGSVDFTVMLVPDSVKLYEKVNDAWVEYHDPSEPWVYTFEERSGSGNTKEKLIHISGIPDGKILQLRYSYEIEVANAVKGTKYTLPTINNTSALTGTSIVTDSTQTTETWESFSTQAGTVSGGTLKVVKVDSQNYSTKLQGAKFKLEKYTTSGWVQIDAIGNGTENLNGHQVYVSNANGLIQISQPVSGTQFDQNTAYRIVEVEAPEGYSVGNPAATAYFYFATTGTVNPVPTDTNWNKADNLNVESDNMWIGNEKTPELIITKSIIGEPITDAQKNAITFTVAQNGSPVGSPITLSAFTYNSSTGVYSYRITAGIENNTTYTVTESNMDVSGVRRVTTYSVNSKPAVSGDSASVPVRYGTGTVDFTNAYGETDISATKVWNDQNNANSTRPASVTLHLLQDGVDMGSTYQRTLTADTWSASWTGLDVGHAYTVEEEAVAGYDSSVVYTQDSSTVNALTGDGTVAITNNLTRIYVEKEWAPAGDTHDGISSIEVELYRQASGSSDWESVGTKTLNAGNNWKDYWDNLDDGYTYKVVENTTLTVYTTTYKINGAAGNNEAVQRGDTVTVVNTKLEGLKIEKRWVDNYNDTTRNCNSINVHIEKSNNNGERWIDAGVVQLTPQNNWYYELENQEPGYIYRVKEKNSSYIDMENGGTASFGQSSYVVSYSLEEAILGDTVVITNTKLTTGIAVHKEWDNSLDSSEIKPITVKLMEADYQPSPDAITVTIVEIKGETSRQSTIHVKQGTDIVFNENSLINGGAAITGITTNIQRDCTITIAYSWGNIGDAANCTYISDIVAITSSATEKNRVTLSQNGTATVDDATEGSANWYKEWTTGLNASKCYYVEEVTEGYEVTYSANNSGIKTGTITITNTKQNNSTGALTIHKTVSGASTDELTNDTFSFTVTLTAPDGVTLADSYPALKNNAAIDPAAVTTSEGVKTIVFTLKHGDSYTIQGLPAGTGYIVTEDSDETSGKYTPSITGGTNDNGTGTIANGANSTVTVEVENTRKVSSVQVTKAFSGLNNLPDGFQITNSFNSEVFTISNATGSDPYTWTIQNVPVGTEITFTESGIQAEGYSLTVNGTATTETTATATATAAETTEAVATATFNNVYTQLGNLTVTKTVAGNAGETDKTFSFTVTLTNRTTVESESFATVDQANIAGTLEFANGVATFTLTHNQSLTIQNLPVGTTYTVSETEANADGYTTTSEVTSSIVGTSTNYTIETGETETVTFTNTKDTYGDIQLTKTVNGTNNDETSFTFTVTILNADGTTDTTVTNVTYGAVTFTNGVATLTLHANDAAVTTITGLPNGTRYKIEETSIPKNYALNTVTVTPGTATVNNDGIVTGTITGGTDSVVAITVDNTHTVGSLVVSKTVLYDVPGSTQTFTFTVTIVDASDAKDTSFDGTYGDMTFMQGVATVTLTDGQSATATGLPDGTRYTVTEQAETGYLTTSTSGGTADGVIETGETETVAFTNSKVTSIYAKKVWTQGGAAQNATFWPAGKTVTFQLQQNDGTSESESWQRAKDTNGVDVADVTVTSTEAVSFTNLPADKTYRVVETYDGETTLTGVDIKVAGGEGNDGTSEHPYVVVNDIPLTSVTVTKAWNAGGVTTWPDNIASVTVGLYKQVGSETPTAVTTLTGDPAVSTPVQITFGDGASAEARTFSNLPVYTADGELITYSVQEESVTLSDSGSTVVPVENNAIRIGTDEVWQVSISGYAITNTKSTNAVTVVKRWYNAYGAYESTVNVPVTVELYKKVEGGTDVLIGSKQVTPGNPGTPAVFSVEDDASQYYAVEKSSHDGFETRYTTELLTSSLNTTDANIRLAGYETGSDVTVGKGGTLYIMNTATLTGMQVVMHKKWIEFQDQGMTFYLGQLDGFTTNTDAARKYMKLKVELYYDAEVVGSGTKVINHQKVTDNEILLWEQTTSGVTFSTLQLSNNIVPGQTLYLNYIGDWEWGFRENSGSGQDGGAGNLPEYGYVNGQLVHYVYRFEEVAIYDGSTHTSNGHNYTWSDPENVTDQWWKLWQNPIEETATVNGQTVYYTRTNIENRPKKLPVEKKWYKEGDNNTKVLADAIDLQALDSITVKLMISFDTDATSSSATWYEGASLTLTKTGSWKGCFEDLDQIVANVISTNHLSNDPRTAKYRIDEVWNEAFKPEEVDIVDHEAQLKNTLMPRGSVKVQKQWAVEDTNATAVLLKLRRVSNNQVDAESTMADVYANPTKYGLTTDNIHTDSTGSYIKVVKDENGNWPELTITNLLIKRAMSDGQAPMNCYYFVEEVGYLTSTATTKLDIPSTWATPVYSGGTGNITIDGTQRYYAAPETTVAAGHELIVTNSLNPGSLSLTKQIAAGNTETTQFTFQVVLTPASGVTIDVNALNWSNDSQGSITNKTKDDNTGVVTLTVQINNASASTPKTVTITGIPAGTTYEVTEPTTPDGWYQVGEVEYSDATKTIAASESPIDTVTITNTKGISINVTKVWTKGGSDKTFDSVKNIKFTLFQKLTNPNDAADTPVPAAYTGVPSHTDGKFTVAYKGNGSSGSWETVTIPNLPLFVTSTKTNGEDGSQTTVTYNASYYVVEEPEAAEAGYVLTTAYSANGGAATTADGASVSTDAAVITIINTETAGVELPSTGGTGTAFYTASGLTLLLGAALWLFLRRKREQN